MNIKIFITFILIAFAGLKAQQNEGAKLMKADESGFIKVDKVPVLISELKPSYPEIARLAGIEGTVYLKLLIDEKGNVVKEKVEQGAKDMLDKSALKAAKEAKFSPAMLNDNPVKVWVVLPVAFKLDLTKKVESGTSDEPGMNDFIPVQKLPEMIDVGKPEYPEIAKRAGIEGKVFVKVLVDQDGNPKKAVVIRSDNEVLNQSSINAAMKSKFTPATKDGQPIAVWIVLPYRFALDNKDKGDKGNELFNSVEEAKKNYDMLIKIRNDLNINPNLKKMYNLPDNFKAEVIEENASIGDEFTIFHIISDAKTKYAIIIRKDSTIYRYGASTLDEIHGYIDGLNKSFKENDNIPDLTWLINSKNSPADYPPEALQKKLDGMVTMKVTLNKEDKSVTKVELIKIADYDPFNTEAVKYVKNNMKKIISWFDSTEDRYFKNHPKEVKNRKRIVDVVLITIDYRFEE